MTKRREPLTYQRTLTTIADLIGWSRCAYIVGKNERTVRYWSDPECETEIRMIDAEELDRAYIQYGGDHAPFHRLFAMRLEIAAHGEGRAESLARIASNAARETGEAVSALIDVSAGSFSPKALRTARTELEEALDAMFSALAAIDKIEKSGGAA